MIMHSVLLFCAKSETVNVFFSFVVAVNNPPPSSLGTQSRIYCFTCSLTYFTIIYVFLIIDSC